MKSFLAIVALTLFYPTPLLLNQKSDVLVNPNQSNLVFEPSEPLAVKSGGFFILKQELQTIVDSNRELEKQKELENQKKKEIVKIQPDQTKPKIVVPPTKSQTKEPVASTITQTSNPVSFDHWKSRIEFWCKEYACDPTLTTTLIRVMKCESNGNPNAVETTGYVDSYTGTRPSGLFQHVAGYFDKRAIKYGIPNGGVFDGETQVRVTIKMFQDGQAKQWACK